jgi:phosphoribosyl-AMP cyclohydrolase
MSGLVLKERKYLKNFLKNKILCIYKKHPFIKTMQLNFNKSPDGLLPAIAQDAHSGEVLMLAYINEESWLKTIETGKVHYWSRSRGKLWLKGESSGHVQLVRDILVDCDLDTVVFRVEQLGGAACHTGHRSCFHRRVVGEDLEVQGEPVFDPSQVYHTS